MKTFTGIISTQTLQFTGQNLKECIDFINTRGSEYSCIVEKTNEEYVIGVAKTSLNGSCHPSACVVLVAKTDWLVRFDNKGLHALTDKSFKQEIKERGLQ